MSDGRSNPASSVYQPSISRWAARIAIGAIVVGIVARFWVVSQRGSLWLDEASLALNVLGRGFGELLRPLDWGQAASPGFLWIEKALTVALGPAEWVLRAWPFLAGVLVLPLVWIVGRRLAGPTAAALATVVLSCSFIAIRYTAEAKPYSGDAFAALVIVWLVLRVTDQPASIRRWLTAGAGGALCMLVSLPSVFVLAAAGVALVGTVFQADARTRIAAASAVAMWVGAFAVIWVASLAEATNGAYLREYWAPVMLDPSAPDFIARKIRALGSVAATPLQWTGSVALAIAASTAMAAGWVVVARRDRVAGALVAGPFVIAALASSAGLYPLSDRLAFFAVPLGLIAAGAAVAALLCRAAEAAGHAGNRALVAGAVVLAGWVASDALGIVRAPGSLEPTRTLFTEVRAAAEAGETPVYLFARAVPAWLYVTMDWRAVNQARLAAFRALAGSTDAPAHENLARDRAVRVGEGDTLVVQGGRLRELIGLAPGVRYRIAGPMSADLPSPGWAAEEARRMAAAALPDVWLVASHFFGGRTNDELRPLVDAARAAGLELTEERRAGRDVIAIRFTRTVVPPPAP